MKNSAAAPSGAAEKRRLGDLTSIRRSFVARRAGYCQAPAMSAGSSLRIRYGSEDYAVVAGVPPARLELQPTRLPLQDCRSNRLRTRPTKIVCAFLFVHKKRVALTFPPLS